MKADFESIPSSDTWLSIESIQEGWSNDQKYRIHTKTGEQLFLRISEQSSYLDEKKYYEAVWQLNTLDIPVSKLLDEGYCNDGQHTYRLFRWVEGEDARTTLKNFSPKDQYKLGLQSGHILRKIHQIPAPSDQPSWSDYFNKKIDGKIKSYQACELSYKHADQILDYIDKHRPLLKNRPQCFHQGDFHIGNMLIDKMGNLGVIDFNRLDFGDPWEEFNRIIWCAAQSKYFASGRIHAYFDEEVPIEFFKLMALYIGANQIGALSWAIPFGQKEIDVIRQQTKDVLGWYNNFSQDIPNWYFSRTECP